MDVTPTLFVSKSNQILRPKHVWRSRNMEISCSLSISWRGRNPRPEEAIASCLCLPVLIQANRACLCSFCRRSCIHASSHAKTKTHQSGRCRIQANRDCRMKHLLTFAAHSSDMILSMHSKYIYKMWTSTNTCEAGRNNRI